MQQRGGDGERRADAKAHHHVADLAHGRKRQHALQVGLHHGVHHADGHGHGSDPHQALAPRGRPHTKTVHARRQIHARRDITSRVQ